MIKWPNEPVDAAEPLTPPPTNLIPLPLNSPVNEPLISDAICCEPDRVPSIEPDTIFAPNSTIAAADKEPLISVDICANLILYRSPLKGT